MLKCGGQCKEFQKSNKFLVVPDNTMIKLKRTVWLINNRQPSLWRLVTSRPLHYTTVQL